MSECHICHLTQTEGEKLVYRDDTWTVAVAVDVPGWLMLMTNRHGDGPWDLTDVEADSLGRIERAVSRALKDVTGAEKVYLMFQGENANHFHVLAMARGKEVPPEKRGMALMGAMRELMDSQAAADIAGAVRADLAVRAI